MWIGRQHSPETDHEPFRNGQSGEICRLFSPTRSLCVLDNPVLSGETPLNGLNPRRKSSFALMLGGSPRHHESALMHRNSHGSSPDLST
jgi:hypothetical protein